MATRGEHFFVIFLAISELRTGKVVKPRIVLLYVILVAILLLDK